jgi:hypothetical protein
MWNTMHKSRCFYVPYTHILNAQFIAPVNVLTYIFENCTKLLENRSQRKLYDAHGLNTAHGLADDCDIGTC